MLEELLDGIESLTLEEKMALEAERTAKNKAGQEMNETLLNLERSASRLEQKIATSAMEEKQILDRLWEHYSLSHSDAQAQRTQLESVPKANRRIGELRREIGGLGTPNIGAIEEFDRVNTRYTYLTDQRNDVDKAKEYLAAAMEELGYSDVSQLPQLELITWDTSEQKLLLETIIDQWKQNLGLENIQLTQYVIGTAIGSFYDLSYDLFAITWETDVLPTDIMEAMVTGGEVNYGIWSDAQFDSLVEQAINELEPDKQAELTAQAEQIFLDNAAILPLYENGVTGAVQSYVEGFQMSATSSGYQFNHLVVHK